MFVRKTAFKKGIEQLASCTSSSLLHYFFLLLIRPARTINHILKVKPDFKRIIIFLFMISILRGLIESIWMLMREGQLWAVCASPVLLKSYLHSAVPFMISSITSGYVRWAGFALVPCLLARFLGKAVCYKDFLRITGVMMGLYVMTVIPNFAYLFFDLPVIHFQISQSYNPALGIGQMISGAWLILIMYKASRIICGLTRWQSVLAAMSVYLGNLGVLIFGAMVFFNLPFITGWSFQSALNTATLWFNIATAMLIPVFLWIGTRWTTRGAAIVRM